jgi:hypothetical protein
MSTHFTPKQLEDFKAYCKVQKTGLYNLLDGQARKLSGLDMESYLFVVIHYESLKKESLIASAGQALEEAYPFGYHSEDGP